MSAPIFVALYGDCPCIGWLSSIGMYFGCPKIAALLTYTNFLTPALALSWSMLTVPRTFVLASESGSSVDFSTLTWAARTEALFVDHTYTAKALAALVAYAREGHFAGVPAVLFWHTGGQIGLFA